MAHYIFLGAMIVRLIAFLVMAGATYLWFTVPERIVYRESAPRQTADHSVEVRQRGTSYYITPAQKRTLDRLNSAMPVVWFGGAGLSVLSFLVGAAARLKMSERDAIRVAMGKL